MSLGELIHVAAIQIRVTGMGAVIPTLFSYDEIESGNLNSIPIQPESVVEPVRLASFISHRCKLRLETTEINEVFKVNHIIIYHKPIYTQRPNNV